MIEQMFDNRHPLKERDLVTEAQRVIYRARRPLRHPIDGIPLWTANLQQRGFSPATIYSYRRSVRRLLAYDPKPDMLSIEAHIADLREQDLEVNTLIHHIKSIKSFFTFLEQHRLWRSNPAQHIIYPKVQKKERAIPSAHDIRILFSQQMSQMDRLFFVLFLDTGLRLSELASIRLDRINLSDRGITVRGKGSKERIVPFSASVGKLLGDYIPQVAQAQEGKSPQWLFPARRRDTGKGHLVIGSFQRRLSDLCQKAGIAHLTPHQLRHFFATYQLTDGADVKAVSKMLGHASVATTLDIYHHVDREAIRQIHDEHSPLRALEGD